MPKNVTRKPRLRTRAHDVELDAGDMAVVRRLFTENIGAHVPNYVAATVLMAMTAAATGASAWIMKDIVNSIFVSRRGELLLPIALAVVVIFLVKGVAAYGSSVIMSRIGARIVADLKKRIVARLLRQGMAFYDVNPTGELTTRLNQYASAAREVMNTLVSAGARDVLSLVALVAVMIGQDPILALMTMLIGPPAIFGASQIVRRTRALARTQIKAMSQIVQLLNESLRGARVVKTFGLERDRQRTIDGAIDEVEAHSLAMSRLNAITSPLMETLGGVGIAAIVGYGGWRVIAGSSDAGAFFSFITAFLMAYEPAKRLIRLNVQLKKQIVGVRMLYELLDEPLAMADRPGAIDLPSARGDIVFEDVAFAYRGASALHGVTLNIHDGEMMAIVGQSGAGKSTLFNLLSRFYDADGGRILIAGHDIRDLTIRSLRASMAVVTQDPFLFSGSIRDNVMMGRLDATEEQFLQAVRAARVDEFADAAARGYDTEVGEHGARLSGGQRQRVAIARAMLKDAPILLLDEATSALDTRSEALVQSAIDRLQRGRTSIVIAHRLSTVRNADRVAVMSAGRVIEVGTHAELLASSGEFKALYDLQFASRDTAAE